jgi:hypothetical protein
MKTVRQYLTPPRMQALEILLTNLETPNIPMQTVKASMDGLGFRALFAGVIFARKLNKAADMPGFPTFKPEEIARLIREKLPQGMDKPLVKGNLFVTLLMQ